MWLLNLGRDGWVNDRGGGTNYGGDERMMLLVKTSTTSKNNLFFIYYNCVQETLLTGHNKKPRCYRGFLQFIYSQKKLFLHFLPGVNKAVG